jgi:very-short-patch-repair endonuclease
VIRQPIPLDRQCEAVGLPVPETEVQFHPVRLWRADYLWRHPYKLIVEVDGGLFVQGRHSRGVGAEKDMEKHAAALALGYRVLRVSPRHVKDGRALQWIEEVLNG